MELMTYVKLNTILNIHQSFKLNDIKKLNQKQLEVSIANNKQLQKINSEIRVANETNRKILENQYKEIHAKEEQKYHKSLSFAMGEIADSINTVKDPQLQYYLLENNFEKIKNSIVNSIDTLDEINDKQFCKVVLDRLNTTNNNIAKYKTDFEKSILVDANKYIEEIAKEENKILGLKKPNTFFIPIIDKPKQNTPRLAGIAFTALISFGSIGVIMDEGAKGMEDYFTALLFILVFFGLLFFEIKWRKGYGAYIIAQNKLREKLVEEENKILNRYNEEIELRKEAIKQSESYKILEQINMIYPEFLATLNYIGDIQSQFDAKWNLSPNEKSK